MSLLDPFHFIQAELYIVKTAMVAIYLMYLSFFSSLGPSGAVALQDHLTAAGSVSSTSDSDPVEGIVPDTQLGDQHYSLARSLAVTANSSDWGASYDHMLQAAHYGHPQAQHALAAAYSAGLYEGLRIPMDPGR